MNKKTINKFSKTFFAGFFIFQFAVMSSLAPVIVNAEEIENIESGDISTKIEEPVKEETPVSEEETIGDSETTQQESEVKEEQNIENSSIVEEKIANENARVSICHTTGNGGHVLITVDDDGSYNGHSSHEGDIIPATDENGDKQITQEDCGYVPPTPTCDASQNLFVNGDFESPSISGSWGVYPTGTSGLAWDIAWQAGSGDNSPAKAELQKIYNAKSGQQYLELDSDFDGPGGSISNEAASTRISQQIATVPGQKYQISYYYSPRPGYGMADNKVGLYIDGFPWDLSVTTNGTNNTDTVWIQKFNTFTADSTSHTITFADLGTPNSFGMFIDDGGTKNTPPVITVDPSEVQVISGANCDAAFILSGVTGYDTEDGDVTSNIVYSGTVDCNTPGEYTIFYDVEDSEGLPAVQKSKTIIVVSEDPENPSCDVKKIWARVVITEYSNNGLGNLTNTIYLGSSTNTVASGEWFSLSNVDPSNIEDYADVPGIALRRRADNKITLELHGSHPTEESSEYVDGYIEFFSGVPTLIESAVDQNKLEYSGSFHDDNAWIVGDKAYFDLGVNTADDRFLTTYTYAVDENCDDTNGGNPTTPTCEANGNEIWAKITLSEVVNEGAGNLKNRIYVGSNSTYINSGVWFMVHDGTNAIVDPTLFENVPGVAVQRVNGKVRFGIHGSHPERKPYAYEKIVGTIEFFQGDITTWENDLSDNNKVDGAEAIVPDSVSVSSNILNFNLGVDIADDFLYAPYTFNSCDDGNNGGDDDGGGNGGNGGNNNNNNSGNGGSSGSFVGGGSNRAGEVLGATTSSCPQFTQYHDTGSRKSEVRALQTFLNEYMDAGLTVNGLYDFATTQAVHNFQAKHWNEIIKPWLGSPSAINPNTTGRTRQTTMSAMNFIINCPNQALFLEDPKIMYEITEIKDQKILTPDQIAKITALLDEANAGLVLGTETVYEK